MEMYHLIITLIIWMVQFCTSYNIFSHRNRLWIGIDMPRSPWSYRGPFLPSYCFDRMQFLLHFSLEHILFPMLLLWKHLVSILPGRIAPSLRITVDDNWLGIVVTEYIIFAQFLMFLGIFKISRLLHVLTGIFHPLSH